MEERMKGKVEKEEEELGSIFRRYRPTFHVIAPRSFMNDPCGATYIPETREYLLCYQWAPKDVESYGDVWGCCVSKDLIHWEDRPNAIEAGRAPYDRLKVFSGSIYNRKEAGKSVLYLFYTSVSHLPIHWTKPYKVGSETQSVAVSRDFGRSWQRHPANPLLRHPPFSENTTGWRDPSVSLWPAMAQLLGLSADTFFMVLSSGTRTEGPRVMLYRSSDLIEWTEVGILFSPVAGSKVSPDSVLQFGHNFECVSFCTIDSIDFLLLGIEADSSTNDRHSSRWTIWLAGDLTLDATGVPNFCPRAHGTLDHDIMYAMHLTRDTDNRLLQYGWLDEDMNSATKEQNWSGSLGLPRYLTLRTLPDSTQPINSHAWYHSPSSGTISTLDVQPIDACETILRGPARRYDCSEFDSIRSTNFEFCATFKKTVSKVTFICLQNETKSERTSLVIDVENHVITLDRSASSLNNGNWTNRTGHFELFDETLQVRVFCDTSLLEIFVNGRFCMSSRVYTSDESSNRVALNVKESDILSAVVYDGLEPAWPGRS